MARESASTYGNHKARGEDLTVIFTRRYDQYHSLALSTAGLVCCYTAGIGVTTEDRGSI